MRRGLIVRHVRPWYDPYLAAPLYDWPGYQNLHLKFTYPPNGSLGPVRFSGSCGAARWVWRAARAGLGGGAGPSPGQARTASIPVLMAGSFISAEPAIVVYLIFQRYLVRGLTLGMGK